MNPKIDKRKVYTKVKHPEFGYVTFTGLTLRQQDILDYYDKITNIKKNKTTIFK